MGDICPILHATSVAMETACLEDKCAWWAEPAKTCAIMQILELLKRIQGKGK